jgi:CRISPR-associated protein Csb2
MFQALVNAAAARWNERMRLEYAVPALTWLAKQSAPTVVASVGIPSEVKYRTFVPDNTGDLAAGAWSRGDTTRIVKRTEKDVRPTHLKGEAVHYLYPIADSDSDFAKHRETLTSAARSITHLGWGVDMVVGNASVISDDEVAKLNGERWQPSPDTAGTRLRVPCAGTLDALTNKHDAFLNRLAKEGFTPVPPLTAFDTISYRRDTEPASRLWVAFHIASVDPDQPNLAFEVTTRCRDVAAWVRHATAQVCDGWPWSDFASFVHGHTANGNRLKGECADERFMYLPLPSIERRDSGHHVGLIRRVLIATPPGFQDRIDWIRRRMPGQELVWGTRVVGLLNNLSPSDWVLRQYTGEGSVWSTVTPVVIPGHDEAAPQIIARRARLAEDEPARRRVHEQANERTDQLLRKAFEQAGLPAELVRAAVLEWRSVGFRSGVETVRHYQLPDTLSGRPTYHVRVRFPVALRGPLVVGAGRYRGFGLFSKEERP